MLNQQTSLCRSRSLCQGIFPWKKVSCAFLLLMRTQIYLTDDPLEITFEFLLNVLN